MAKGPMYHGHGYGWENRWEVIHQTLTGDEQIVDAYLSRQDAEDLLSALSSCTGECFIREMTNELQR